MKPVAMPGHKYFLFAFTCLLLTCNVQAGDSIIVHSLDETDSINFLDYAAYYTDKSKQVDWPDVETKTFIYTNPSPWKDRAYQQKKTALWLTCTLINASPDSIPLLLVFYRFAYFKKVIIQRKQVTTVYQPNYFFSPVIKTSRKNVTVLLGPGERVRLWVQIIDPNVNLYAFNLYFTNIPGYKQFLSDEYKTDYTYYIFRVAFLAIVAFIITHTLVQYFIRRRREFLYYAQYAFFVFLFFLQNLEMSFHYDLIFSFFPFIHKYSHDPLSILVYYTYFRFARQFIDFRAWVPWFDTLIRWAERILLIMLAADIFCAVFAYHNLQCTLFIIVRLLALVISFIGIFLLLRSGKNLWYFFGIGSLLLVIGSLLSMIYSFYPERISFFSDDSLRPMQVGIILELLCFTSGLSYKSHLIEVEKQNTQLELIEQLKENRRLQDELTTQLETRVKEQTGQILAQQQQLEKEKEQQLTIEFKKKLTEMELQVLKSQLNPHFYFNTLHNLYGLTIIDPKKAPDAILKLSDIMEYIIYDCKTEKVSLVKELKFINSYIELEKLRYEDHARIIYDQYGDSNGKLISPLLLIQFIENAFKHGMEQDKKDNYLEVDITVDNNHLFFRSVNSTKQKTHSNHGLGLSNVQKRLRMLYPNRHQLSIDESASEFKVELHLELT